MAIESDSKALKLIRGLEAATMKHIKQIFLDLDGPLLDGKDRHYRCYQSILESFGFKPIGIDEYWTKKRALVNRRELLRMSNAEAIYDDFLGAWLKIVESPTMLALDKVQEGAVDCLRLWKEHGIAIILVTMRKQKLALDHQLVLTGLSKYINTVLVCNHAEGGKGKAEAVRKLFPSEQFKKHVLWIGDTEADWEAARSLGCEVFLVANGMRDEVCLSALQGAVVMPSIASLEDKVLGSLNVS